MAELIQEPKVCGYCDKEIIGVDFIYKFFPEEKIHKPVHGYHLRINKEVKSEVQTKNTRRSWD